MVGELIVLDTVSGPCFFGINREGEVAKLDSLVLE